MELRSPLIGIRRHCFGTDGHGITTLIAFHGCPLHCKYCLNPQCLDSNAIVFWKTPKEVMDILKKDKLYYLATNGGITFGGGEPLLYCRFIGEVIRLGADRWNVTLETSLNVPLQQWATIADSIDEYIIDIKDMNPFIYRNYTTKNNYELKKNMQWLIDNGKSGNIVVRVPFINGYNTLKNQEESEAELKEMGITKIQRCTYRTI